MNKDLHQQNSHPFDDRFEHLSAYLDGELAVSEQAEVERWLADDPQAREHYRQLVRLHSSFSQLPVPASAQHSGEATAELVLERLDRPRWLPKPKTRWGKFSRHYAPIAAGAIAAFTGWAAWDLSHPPEPIVSLDMPPVVIPTLVSESPATQEAGTYLLAPSGDRDPYSILFDDEAPPQWQ